MSYQRDFDRRLNVAVVGVGSHAYRNILPALHYLPVRLAALCDVKREALERTGPEYGVTRLYTSTAEMYAQERLDAVLLCVGPAGHPGLAAEALRAGLHVWMEKPAAYRTSELEGLLGLRGGRQVVVGFKKAFMPATRKAKEILALPQTGRLRSVLAEYPVAVPGDGARVLSERTFSNWLGNGCHPLSAMVELAGPAAGVTTLRSTGGGGACLIEFAGGAFGNLHFAVGMRGPNERYTLLAENAEIVIENSRKVNWHRGVPFDYSRSTSYAPAGLDHGSVVWEPGSMLSTLENKALFSQGIYDELMAFCRAALEGTPPATGTLEFAISVQKVYEAALLSDGQRVAVA